MQQLPNAPVEYVLGIVRFPPTANLQPLVAAAERQLRQIYPISKQFKAPHFNIDLQQSGLRVEQVEREIWQLASEEGDWAVFIGNDMLGVHTINYRVHQDFIGRAEALVAAASVSGDIGVVHMTAVGMRYVSVIEPKPDEKIESYLKQFMPASSIDGVNKLDFEGGVFSSSFNSEIGKLRVQVFRNPPSILPPDLASVMTIENKWVDHPPAGDFAVVDLDHSVQFDAKRISVKETKEIMSQLHDKISAVFAGISTDHAMTVWSDSGDA